MWPIAPDFNKVRTEQHINLEIFGILNSKRDYFFFSNLFGLGPGFSALSPYSGDQNAGMNTTFQPRK